MDEARLERDLLHATLYAQYILGTGTLLSFVGWQEGTDGDPLTMAIVDHHTQIEREGPVVGEVARAMRRMGYRFDRPNHRNSEIGIVSAGTAGATAHQRMAALARLCGTEGAT